jgi:hypothetical protein
VEKFDYVQLYSITKAYIHKVTFPKLKQLKADKGINHPAFTFALSMLREERKLLHKLRKQKEEK